MIEWVRITLSAHRLKLRDKGETEINISYKDRRRCVSVHTRCSTRLRIGIDKEGNAHLYCWKCEEIAKPETKAPTKPGPPGTRVPKPKKRNHLKVVGGNNR